MGKNRDETYYRKIFFAWMGGKGFPGSSRKTGKQKKRVFQNGDFLTGIESGFLDIIPDRGQCSKSIFCRFIDLPMFEGFIYVVLYSYRGIGLHCRSYSSTRFYLQEFHPPLMPISNKNLIPQFSSFNFPQSNAVIDKRFFDRKISPTSLILAFPPKHRFLNGLSAHNALTSPMLYFSFSSRRKCYPE